MPNILCIEPGCTSILGTSTQSDLSLGYCLTHRKIQGLSTPAEVLQDGIDHPAPEPVVVTETGTWIKASSDLLASDETPEHVVWVSTYPSRVTSVTYTPSAGLVADNTDYAVVTVTRRDAGTGANPFVVASQPTLILHGNWVAFAAHTLPVANPVLLAPGDLLTITITKTGLGVVVPQGVLCFSYHRVY